jgi:hypothetical protein
MERMKDTAHLHLIDWAGLIGYFVCVVMVRAGVLLPSTSLPRDLPATMTGLPDGHSIL